jgi:hypothetical protein
VRQTTVGGEGPQALPRALRERLARRWLHTSRAIQFPANRRGSRAQVEKRVMRARDFGALHERLGLVEFSLLNCAPRLAQHQIYVLTRKTRLGGLLWWQINGLGSKRFSTPN